MDPRRKAEVMRRRAQQPRVEVPPISDLAFGSKLLASTTQFDTTASTSYAERDGLRGADVAPRPKEKTSLHLGDDKVDYSVSAPMAKAFRAYSVAPDPHGVNAAASSSTHHSAGDLVALRAASWSFAHPGDDASHFKSTTQLQQESVLAGYARPKPRVIDASVEAAAAAEKHDRPPPTCDDGVDAVDDEARLGGETVRDDAAGGAVVDADMFSVGASEGACARAVVSP